MRTILERLQSYFQSTAHTQIDKDWKDCERYNNVGPLIDDFICQSKLFYEAEVRNSYWEISCTDEILENPKFASDFFLY